MRGFAAVLACSLAAAQPAKEQAGALLREATDAFATRDFERALAKFQAAYRIFPSPKLQAGIAAAYRELGDPVRSLEFYERFFAEVSESDDPRLWRDARRDAEAVRERVGEIEVRASPATLVTIDGREAAPGVSRVAAGSHVVVAGAHRAEVDVPGRGRALVVSPEPAGEKPPPPGTTAGESPAAPVLASAPPARETRPPLYRRWWFWSGVGAAVAGAVVGAILLPRGGDGGPADDQVVDLRTMP